MGNTVGSLTQLQRSVVIGSLLGDGYLRIVRGRKNAFLEVNHALRQKAYVDWKYSILRSISRSAPKARSGNGNRIAYRFTTRQHPELTELFSRFYKNGRKLVPEFRADPVTIAVWFMDDGSMCRSSDVYFNTQQFDFEDQKRCMALLSEFAIESSLNRDKQYWRIRIIKSSLPKLWTLITPNIIPAMNYKLGYNPVETHLKEWSSDNMPELTRQLPF